MLSEPGTIHLNYSEAEAVGKRLCTRFSAITGHRPPIIKGEAWADLVQAVLRWSNDAVKSRKPNENQEGQGHD